jgi:hypothetical protein
MKPMFCVRSVVFFVIGILMIGPASAGEFRAEMTLKPIDIRDVETSAADVKRIVLAVLAGTVSSETTPQISGATNIMHATSVAPKDGTPKVFGHEALRTPDGSMLYLHFEGVPSRATVDKVGFGTWSVLEGTGALSGATGQGEYTFRFVSQEVGALMIFEGNLNLN